MLELYTAQPSTCPSHTHRLSPDSSLPVLLRSIRIFFGALAGESSRAAVVSPSSVSIDPRVLDHDSPSCLRLSEGEAPRSRAPLLGTSLRGTSRGRSRFSDRWGGLSRLICLLSSTRDPFLTSRGGPLILDDRSVPGKGGVGTRAGLSFLAPSKGGVDGRGGRASCRFGSGRAGNA